MLVPIGGRWISPDAVIGVEPNGSDSSVVYFGLGDGQCWFVSMPPAEVAALLSPPPPAPAREAHPSLSAYLDVVRTVCAGGYVSGEQVTAWEAWHQAGFPIWAEP